MIHNIEKIFHLVHDLVKLSEAMVVKVFVKLKTPLTTAPVIAPIVALPRKINPLWMAELVAHEVKVCLSSERKCDKADHFVESDSSIDNHMMVFSSHVMNLLIE